MRPAKKVDIRDYLKKHPDLRTKDLDKEAWYWSDFSNQKNFNPKLFNDSLKFWSNVLFETSKRSWLSEDILCLNRENLEEAFSVHSGVSPAGFNCVIQELYHSSELIPIEEYYSYMKSNYSWSGWILQSLFWGLQKVTGANNVLGAKKLVIMPTLKEAAERVLQYHENNAVHEITDNLFTFTSFKAEYAAVAVPNVVLSDTDLRVLLCYLEFEQKMLVTEAWHEEKEEELIIKMRPKKEKNISKLEITEADRGIICIKETSKKLRTQVEDVEEKIVDLNKKISGYLIRKQKVQAKYSLKQKKNIEYILSKRMGSLNAIEGILLKIQGAASDSEIIDIYSFGAGALKGVLASEGLTTESVDETMDKLQDALADQKEIDDAMQMNQTLIEASLEIDDELEEELEALLEEEDAVISTPVKQPIPQPVIESTVSQPVENSATKKAIEDKELEELEKMFAEMDALPSAPQHTPKTADSKSKQREEIMVTSE